MSAADVTVNTADEVIEPIRRLPAGQQAELFRALPDVSYELLPHFALTPWPASRWSPARSPA